MLAVVPKDVRCTSVANVARIAFFEEAQLAIVTVSATGSGLYVATAGAYGPYQSCVRANRLRLDS
jgi:hypothetical protein